MDPDAQKGRVARVALARICSYGFALTTLEDVTAAAGLDDAAGRALFRDKEGLLSALVSPVLSGVRDAVASAATSDLSDGKQLRTVIQRYADVLVAHRELVAVILGDPTAPS